MKRSLIAFSFILALTVSSFSQQATKTAKLTDRQVLSLITTAKTPADHTRIAEYYKAQASSYLAHSKEHEDMAKAYKQNVVASSPKYVTATVNHCEYIAESFKNDAKKAQELADLHEEMAKSLEKK